MPFITTNLDSWLEEEIHRFWGERGEEPGHAVAVIPAKAGTHSTLSSAMNHVAREWWAMTHFPAIAFRDGVSGRRAGLRSGPDVWEIVMVARDYDGDRNGLAEHFGESVRHEDLEQALAYAERFPEEVEAMIAGNEEVGRNH